MRIHVGFFGITRSLRHTAGSIQDNILAPLRKAGEVRLSGHFHAPAVIDNPRSGEIAVAVDPGEVGLLGLDVCLMERQDEALIAAEWAAARGWPDILGDEYRSARNLCFQLRSLRRVWGLMAGEVTAADRVVFLRPDLRYLDALPVAAILARMHDEEADFAVPGWHSWGGLNDRFAVASARGAEVYARRGDGMVAGMAERGGLHGESLFAYAVRAAGLHVIDLPVRAVRVRGNGIEEERDLKEFGLS